MKAVIWDDESLGATFHDEDIPADLQDNAKMQEAAKMLQQQATYPGAGNLPGLGGGALPPGLSGFGKKK